MRTNFPVEKLEVKRTLGRSRRRWKSKNFMDLREIGWEVVDWTDLARDSDLWRALVNTARNQWVPLITEPPMFILNKLRQH